MVEQQDFIEFPTYDRAYEIQNKNSTKIIVVNTKYHTIAK